MNTFARIESVCPFRDGLSFLMKSISLITQSNLFEHLVNSGRLDFSNFKFFDEFSADEHRLNCGLDF